MSNEENPEQQQYGQPGPYDGWQPTPQSGEYDAEATAFVHLPPEDLANIPLAAPGQGYVPPMIVPLTPAAGLDPSATGSWVVQTQGGQAQAPASPVAPPSPEEHTQPETVHWPDPNQQYEETSSITAGSTAQWDFSAAVPRTAPESRAPEGYDEHGEHGEHPGHTGHSAPAETSGGHTGQWTIPVADGDLPDESGEFAASALASPWHPDRLPPATLPGGAQAPWAIQPEPEPAPEPGREPEGDTAPDAPSAPRTPEAPDAPHVPEAPETADGPDPIGPADTSEASRSALADIARPPSATDVQDLPGLDQDLPGLPGLDQDLPGLDEDPARVDVPSEHPAASYVLTVNGVDRPVADAWIGESLLYVLRERLGLAGAKDGCSQGECGACNIQVDGRLVASCLVPAATAAGSEVRTVEGLAVDGEPSDVQRALADCGAVQCGFCIPGMAMTVHDLLEGNHAPSELETRQALCGNLCRCSGYRGVLDAVREVVAGREAAAGQDADDARIPHQAAPGAGSVQAHPPEGDAR